MWGTIINVIFKLGLKFVDMYMKRAQRDKKMTESYYDFLDQIDKAGMANVANYMAAENALEAKKQEIQKRLKAEAAESEAAKKDPPVV